MTRRQRKQQQRDNKMRAKLLLLGWSAMSSVDDIAALHLEVWKAPITDDWYVFRSACAVIEGRQIYARNNRFFPWSAAGRMMVRRETLV